MIPYRRKILAVASGGGHWVQLKRVLPALEGHDVAVVSTDAGYAREVAGYRFHVVRDASRWDRLRLVQQILQVLWILLRERPGVVVSTGALPGLFAIIGGKVMGARTIWIDSIANADKMSMSGKKARRFADLWLTQWEQVARPGGPAYEGRLV